MHTVVPGFLYPVPDHTIFILTININSNWHDDGTAVVLMMTPVAVALLMIPSVYVPTLHERPSCKEGFSRVPVILGVSGPIRGFPSILKRQLWPSCGKSRALPL